MLGFTRLFQFSYLARDSNTKTRMPPYSSPENCGENWYMFVGGKLADTDHTDTNGILSLVEWIITASINVNL